MHAHIKHKLSHTRTTESKKKVAESEDKNSQIDSYTSIINQIL